MRLVMNMDGACFEWQVNRLVNKHVLCIARQLGGPWLAYAGTLPAGDHGHGLDDSFVREGQ
jgi:hypothetical protein